MTIQHQHNIIAICGPSGSGKSTLAEFLEREYKYIITSFADPFKRMLTEFVMLQGCSYETATQMFYGDLKDAPSPYFLGKTPRHAMQTIATEWGRDLIHQDFWTNAWKKNISKLHCKYNIVVDDLRFLSEERILRTLDNVIIVGITRHGYDMGQHQSEKEYSKIQYDIIIHNDSTLEDVYVQFKRKINALSLPLSPNG